MKIIEGLEDVFYMLQPTTMREKDWINLRWKFIKDKTVSVHKLKYQKSFGLGFNFNRSDRDNGWGRYYKCLGISIFLFNIWITGWVKWDFAAMVELPQNQENK